jgi:CubicO group peptidase (beta-lactamase class C family)
MKKKLTYLFLILVLTACAAPGMAAIPDSEPAYWPTSGWRSSTPEAQGMDSGLLAQMIEEISANRTGIHSLLVIRNGYLVTEAYFHPYTRHTKVHVQSVTKSFIGALTGIAIQKKVLSDVDQPLLSFFQNRRVAHLSEEKSSIQLRHLLSMSSGLDCQEFSPAGKTMEHAADWVQFTLDLPVVHVPGQTFGYCNGNAHLLSVILEKASDMSTREFANQELFAPLGIPYVEEEDWGEDPQGFVTGGYGLHLRPVDLAKFALLYLHHGKWDGQQILPEEWVTESTTGHVQKEDGTGYGYLWTVYPGSDHYAALGLGGQQIHVYPSKNLIVVVTASLESFAEAPEIEKILNENILPAIRQDTPLAEHPEGFDRLARAIETAAHPVRAVPTLPPAAANISSSVAGRFARAARARHVAGRRRPLSSVGRQCFGA